MPTDSTDAHTRTCPVCGHDNVPHAQFCAKCGHALNDDAVAGDAQPDETQVTSIYEPIGSPESEPTWGEPEAERTAALPVRDAVWSPAPPATSAPVPLATVHPESPRGFILGLLATLIILAVLGTYVYAAWLSESLQDDIASWMPW